MATTTAGLRRGPGTRWSSAFSDPQWVQVDLGTSQRISKVVLTWESAYATAFQIQTSDNGTTWTPIYSTTAETTGTGGTQTLNVSGSGRFVRMYGTARATPYGYSLWEFLVFGGGTPQLPCTAWVGTGRPTTASPAENAGTPASAAFDGCNNTRWSSAAADPQWLQVDLGSPQDICGVPLLGDGLRDRVPDPGLVQRHDLEHRVLNDRRGGRRGDPQLRRRLPLCTDVRHRTRHPVGLPALGVQGADGDSSAGRRQRRLVLADNLIHVSHAASPGAALHTFGTPRTRAPAAAPTTRPRCCLPGLWERGRPAGS